MLFGISVFLWNCDKDFEYIETETIEAEELNLKTVHLSDAKLFFNTEIEKKENKYLEKGATSLEISPNWSSASYQDIYKIEGAKLTSADVQINREGKYDSQLFFINSKGKIKNVIYTVYKDKTDFDGEIIDGRIYFNKINGEFIDGYIIEGGLFTHRMIIKSKQNTQQAGFFRFSFLQSNTKDADCWNTDNLPEEGTTLDNVDLGTLAGGGGGYIGSDNIYSIISSWNHNGNSGSEGSNNYSGGGGGPSSVSARIFAETEDTDQDGNCPGIKVKNPSTQKCECPEGKIEDKNGNCICPPGYIEDSNGNCVKKPCEGNPLAGQLEIAPQKGASKTKGALFGCTRSNPNLICGGVKGKKEHAGIDIKTNIGDPIYAMYDGTIYSTGRQKTGAGYNTRIQSRVNGKVIITSYFHMQKDNRIEQNKPGTPIVKVKAGDIIGYQGTSGNLYNAVYVDKSVDIHVHIEVRLHDGGNKWDYKKNFKLVEPRDYLFTKIDNNGVSQTNTNCN